jgi:acyl carrier protein
MSIQERLRDHLVDQTGDPSLRDRLTGDFPIIESGVIDSQGILTLILFVEGEFDIEVLDEDLVLENVGTLDRLAAYIEIRQRGG